MPPHPLLHKEAPTDIVLKNQHDQDVSLGDMIGQQTVVLFFYPKDNTFVCTKQVSLSISFNSLFFL
jgi:peroxiredoxin Q/BCP